MEGYVAFVIVGAILLVLLSLFFSFVPVGLWISALAANVKVGIMTLIGMRLRRVAPSRIVNPLIKATKAGIDVPIRVDHVPLMPGESQELAGYTALGRLYAIGYLKGILESV